MASSDLLISRALYDFSSSYRLLSFDVLVLAIGLKNHILFWCEEFKINHYYCTSVGRNSSQRVWIRSFAIGSKRLRSTSK